MANPPSPAAATSATARPLYAKLGRRVAIATALILLGMIPTLILYGITKESATTWATAASIAGVTAVWVGGVEVAAAFVMALLTPVAIVAGSTPITGAALMAIMCLVVGRMSRFGLDRATLLVPIFMAWMIIDPPFWGPQHTVDRLDGTYLGWMAVTFFAGAIVPVLVLPFALRKVHLPAPKPHTRHEALPYTVTIIVLASVSTFLVLQHPKQTAGAWLIATILVLTQVGDVGTVRRTIERVVGTLLGMVVLGVIVLRVDSLVVIYVIGLIFAIAAVTAKFSPQYWLYMALITPTVVCSVELIAALLSTRTAAAASHVAGHFGRGAATSDAASGGADIRLVQSAGGDLGDLTVLDMPAPGQSHGVEHAPVVRHE
ncbi:MAG: FUSC family protein [Actinobacteria bacterium]|nr:FUSC family protein [Actinomycetota bacterium]